MNSDQVYSALYILKKNLKYKASIAVLPAERVKQFICGTDCSSRREKIAICNVIPSSRKVMGHWIVLWKKSCLHNPSFPFYIEAFDSFGRNVVDYSSQYFGFLKKFHVVSRKRDIQNENSLLCGHYCLWYIYQRMKNVSLRAIWKQFTRNTLRNDMIVEKWYSKLRITMIRDRYGCVQLNCSKQKFFCESFIYCK